MARAQKQSLPVLRKIQLIINLLSCQRRAGQAQWEVRPQVRVQGHQGWGQQVQPGGPSKETRRSGKA